jgi:RnfABCDGE-type electron transport complex B subunit
MLITIGLAGGTMLAMALIMSYILGWANVAFRVEMDDRVEMILGILPGANCGGCGFMGCSDYAVAIVVDEVGVNKCPVGGQSCAERLASVMGVEAGETIPWRPVVHCGAHYEQRLMRTEYRGVQKCSNANLVANVQGCTYGCLGFGDCIQSCKYDAVHVVDGLATIDYDKCIGCGACTRVCPRNIISLAPFRDERILAVTCSNKDKGKDVKAVCMVGCIGCGACARMSDIITIQNNLSTVDYDHYDPEKMDGLIKASQKCPQKRLLYVGKPTDEQKQAAAAAGPMTIAQADFKTTVDDMEWRG